MGRVVKINFNTNGALPVAPPSASDYVNDFNNIVFFNGTFRPPADFSEADIDAVVGAIGASVRVGLNPCVNTTFVPRKLTFIRANGNSFSLPIADLVTVEMKNKAQAVIDYVKANTGTPVVCVAYDGEIHSDAILSAAPTVVRPAFATIPYIEPFAGAGAKNAFYYKGTATEYFSDSSNNIVPVRFRSLSRTDLTPLSDISALFTGCAGAIDIGQNFTCSSSQLIKYRRVVVEFASLRDGLTVKQSITIPTKERGIDAVTCIENLAAATGVTCVRYEGESNTKYHLSAGLTVG